MTPPPTESSHGFSGYVSPPRPDELPTGTPAPEQAGASEQRRADGTLTQGASTIPSKGGKALKGRTSLSHRIVSVGIPEHYKNRARSFRRAACAELAREVGGGECGVVASALVKLAAEALALSEAALDAGDLETHRKMAESSRMHLVYAREHCAKSAAARPRAAVDYTARILGPHLAKKEPTR